MDRKQGVGFPKSEEAREGIVEAMVKRDEYLEINAQEAEKIKLLEQALEYFRGLQQTLQSMPDTKEAQQILMELRAVLKSIIEERKPNIEARENELRRQQVQAEIDLGTPRS